MLMPPVYQTWEAPGGRPCAERPMRAPRTPTRLADARARQVDAQRPEPVAAGIGTHHVSSLLQETYIHLAEPSRRCRASPQRRAGPSSLLVSHQACARPRGRNPFVIPGYSPVTCRGQDEYGPPQPGWSRGITAVPNQRASPASLCRCARAWTRATSGSGLVVADDRRGSHHEQIGLLCLVQGEPIPSCQTLQQRRARHLLACVFALRPPAWRRGSGVIGCCGARS